MIVLNPKYKPLFLNDTRFFVLTGGRGSAKSFGVGTFSTLLSFEPGHKILYTRQTMTSAHLSIIPEFQEKLELMGVDGQFDISKTEITNVTSGDQIIFKGLKTSSGDQTAALKSLQGVTTWIVDEAEELVDERTFDKINLSIRQKGVQNRVILILNPATKEHWIYKRFFENVGVQPGYNGVKGNVTYIHTTYQDNIKNLDKSFVDEVELMRDTNPSKYQHQILGGWMDKAEGVVYTNWTVGDFKEVSPPVYGQDYGWSVDPTVLVKTSIDKINKKIYVHECFYKQHMTTSEIANLNSIHAGSSLIYGDGQEGRLIDEIKDLGNNIKPAEKGPGSITAGISTLQDYQLVISEQSINIVKELNNYVWHDKKSNTPIDDYNHALDAIRYAVYSQVVNKPLVRPRYSFGK
jgi:phage terminase large subunit